MLQEAVCTVTITPEQEDRSLKKVGSGLNLHMLQLIKCKIAMQSYVFKLLFITVCLFLKPCFFSIKFGFFRRTHSSPGGWFVSLYVFFFLPAVVAESVNVTLNWLNCESVSCDYMLSAVGYQRCTLLRLSISWTTDLLHLLHFYNVLTPVLIWEKVGQKFIFDRRFPLILNILLILYQRYFANFLLSVQC